jgi:ribosomal protein S18 acetylase RimI-like enzyme
MTASDSAVLRDTRLRALRDTPLAFGSTYAKESILTDEQWAERAVKWTEPGRSCAFLAFDSSSGACCGIVAGHREPETFQRVNIYSMWVAPEIRRQGVGRRLIECLEQWARQHEASELQLNATETNLSAIELYRRCGFEMTGETEPYPNAPNLVEFVMRKPIA